MAINNQKQVAYGAQHYKLINIRDYKNDLARIRMCNGTVHDAIVVPWNDISIDQRSHQTRAKDTDIGHVAAIAADIEGVGLETLPTVEWKSRIGKFEPLSGHHRLLAMHRNGHKECPVLVLSFQTESERTDYLAAANNHRAHKRHSIDDVVKLLKRKKASGCWDGLTEERQKQEAYSWLSQHNPWLQTVAKRRGYTNVFKPQIYIKTYTPAEVKEFMKKRFTPKYAKSGHRSGDEVYVGSVWTASQKAVEMAQLDRAEEKLAGTTTSDLVVKLVTHFPKGNMDTERIKALHRYKAKNIHAPGCCVVDEIVFLPQKLGKEKENKPLEYRWDYCRQTFV